MPRAAPCRWSSASPSTTRRWLIHIEAKSSRVEPDKLSRRHLTLPPSTLVRLLMGHTGIDDAANEDGFAASTATASTPPASSSPSSPSGEPASTPRRPERITLVLARVLDAPPQPDRFHAAADRFLSGNFRCSRTRRRTGRSLDSLLDPARYTGYRRSFPGEHEDVANCRHLCDETGVLSVPEMHQT